MKNLLNSSEKDTLEELPHSSKIRTADRWYRRWSHYPGGKICRFLMSRIGKNWDDVYSEFHKLEWVPEIYKSIEFISREVILNTYMKDGKVFYVDKWCVYGDSDRCVDDYRFGCTEMFYVHPKTKCLCISKKTKVDHKKLHAIKEAKTMRILGDYHQLLKLNGFWYEVKAVPVKSNIVEINGLHYRKMTDVWKPKSDPIIVDKLPYIKIGNDYYEPVCVRSYGGSLDAREVGPRDRLLEDETTKSSFYWKRNNYNTIKITLYRQLNSKELKKYGISNDVPKLPMFSKKCKICGGWDCTKEYRHISGKTI